MYPPHILIKYIRNVVYNQNKISVYKTMGL